MRTPRGCNLIITALSRSAARASRIAASPLRMASSILEAVARLAVAGFFEKIENIFERRYERSVIHRLLVVLINFAHFSASLSSLSNLLIDTIGNLAKIDGRLIFLFNRIEFQNATYEQRRITANHFRDGLAKFVGIGWRAYLRVECQPPYGP